MNRLVAISSALLVFGVALEADEVVSHTSVREASEVESPHTSPTEATAEEAEASPQQRLQKCLEYEKAGVKPPPYCTPPKSS